MLRNIIKSFSNFQLHSSHTMAVPIDASTLECSASQTGQYHTTTYANSAPRPVPLSAQLENSKNPAQVLEAAITAPDYVATTVELGQQFDPYRSDESILATTRQLLEILHRHQHPVNISTKSHLVIKDIDLLANMAKSNLCHVTIGLSTMDEALKINMEPRTSSPKARLSAVKKLSQAGIAVNVMASPIIPLINDGELERVLTEGKLAGASQVGYELLLLSNDVKPLFKKWLQQHYPKLAKRVINLVHSSFNGKDERSDFSKSMSGSGVFAAMLEQRFNQICKQLDVKKMK